MNGCEQSPEKKSGQVVMMMIFILAGVYIAGRGFCEIIEQHELFLRQAEVQGRIVFNRIMKSECTECPTWRRVVYGYEYQGREYSGTRLWPLDNVIYSLDFLSYGDVADDMEKHFHAKAKVGESLPVYLDRLDPAYSYVFDFYSFGPCLLVFVGLNFIVFVTLHLLETVLPSWNEKRKMFHLAALFAWIVLNGAAIGEYFLSGRNLSRHTSVRVFHAACIAFVLGGAAFLLVSFFRKPKASICQTPGDGVH